MSRSEKQLKDYSMGGKIKIKDTFEPKERPKFEDWMKQLNTSELVYLNDPQAKKKADEITKPMGIKIDCRTLWEVLTGTTIEESVNYEKEPVRIVR